MNQDLTVAQHSNSNQIKESSLDSNNVEAEFHIGDTNEHLFRSNAHTEYLSKTMKDSHLQSVPPETVKDDKRERYPMPKDTTLTPSRSKICMKKKKVKASR